MHYFLFYVEIYLSLLAKITKKLPIPSKKERAAQLSYFVLFVCHIQEIGIVNNFIQPFHASGAQDLIYFPMCR